jgi:hypothetical protein
LWRETLDDLERSSALADRTLDWAIKRTVFARRLAQLGIEWADLSWWDRVFARLTRRFQHRHADTRDFTMNDVLEPTFWMKGEMDAVAPILEHRGLSWADLPALIAARAEMFELDAKFGGLGDDGIFNQLEKAGVLNHRVREDRVADAVSQPPSDTRAKLRGDAVRRFTAARTPFEAEWTRVVDLSTLRQMDLIDPLQTREVWE